MRMGSFFLYYIVRKRGGEKNENHFPHCTPNFCFFCLFLFLNKKNEKKREKWRMQQHKMMTMDEKNKFFIQPTMQKRKEGKFFVCV